MARDATGTGSTEARLSRRTALRVGTMAGTAGVVGAGLGVAVRGMGGGPRHAAAAGARTLHLEFDTMLVNSLTFSRDGGVLAPGVPRRQGDHCNIAWRLHAVGDLEGEQVGDWHCFGPQVGSTREQGAIGPAFLVTVQAELYGRGKLSGVNYCGGPTWNEGTITGGTGEFFGAGGSFRFGPRAEGGTLAGEVGISFDLLLPELT